MGRTVLVLGDQLSTDLGALADADPGRDRIVMVESWAKLAQRPWHRQKLHLVLGAMRRFAEELRGEGFVVDLRRAPTLRAGLDDAGVDPDHLVATAPSTWDLRHALTRWGVAQVASGGFLVGEEAFARWARGRRSLGLETFYRGVRREHGWLLEPGGEPAGGQWNHDHANRQPPPRGGVSPPAPWQPQEDEIDEAVRADLDRWEHEGHLALWGEDRPRTFAASRSEARAALADFVAHRLPGFGPLEDAVVAEEPVLWHAQLSGPLNLGLLHPREACDAVDRAWQRETDPERIGSYEGFLRQVAGWREYVWGLYWWRMPQWRHDDHLGHRGPVPAAYWDGDTDLRCVAASVADLAERAWLHHIPRLMILGNHALLAGVSPQALTDWFHATFADAYEWVMLPNVVGMSQWADGGVMATKPYAASANYINRMTTYCRGCRYDPKQRTGEDACPFNALYWDFLARHRPALADNPRTRQILRHLDRFSEEERAAIHARARRFRTDVDPEGVDPDGVAPDAG